MVVDSLSLFPPSNRFFLPLHSSFFPPPFLFLLRGFVTAIDFEFIREPPPRNRPNIAIDSHTRRFQRRDSDRVDGWMDGWKSTDFAMIMARGKGEALCFLIHRLGWIVIVESFFYPRNFFKDLRDDLISMEEKKGVIIFQTHYPSKVEDVDCNFYAMIFWTIPRPNWRAEWWKFRGKKGGRKKNRPVGFHDGYRSLLLLSPFNAKNHSFFPPHCSRSAFCSRRSSIRLAVATTPAINDISMNDDLCISPIFFPFSLPPSPSTRLVAHTASRLIGHRLINWSCYFY